jgi:hypothetical protein
LAFSYLDGPDERRFEEDSALELLQQAATWTRFPKRRSCGALAFPFSPLAIQHPNQRFGVAERVVHRMVVVHVSMRPSRSALTSTAPNSVMSPTDGVPTPNGASQSTTMSLLMMVTE